MKSRDKWHDEIGQAAYEAEVGDFRKMNTLLDDIMALQEAAKQSVQRTASPVSVCVHGFAEGKCVHDTCINHSFGLRN